MWSQTYKIKDRREHVRSLLRVTPRRRCPGVTGWVVQSPCGSRRQQSFHWSTVILLQGHACLPLSSLHSVMGRSSFHMFLCVSFTPYQHALLSISSDSSTAFGLCGILCVTTENKNQLTHFPLPKLCFLTIVHVKKIYQAQWQQHAKLKCHISAGSSNPLSVPSLTPYPFSATTKKIASLLLVLLSPL